MTARSERRLRKIIKRSRRKSLGLEVGFWPDDEVTLREKIVSLRAQLAHGWNDEIANDIRCAELRLNKGRAEWASLKELNSTLPYDWTENRSWM